MNKLLKDVLIFSLCIIFACAFAGCTNDTKSPYDEYVSYDETAVADFIENFDKDAKLINDGKIIVSVTEEARQHIKEYTVNDFSQVNAVSLEILSSVGMLFVTISETDSNSMLRATYILRLRSDVKYANPNTAEEIAAL